MEGFQSERDGGKKGERQEEEVMKVEMEQEKGRDVKTHTGLRISFPDPS